MSEPAPKQRSHDSRTLLVRAARAVVFLLIWAALLDLPLPLQNVTLDTSWQAAMSYFATHRFQAGRDFVFTYGPLGFLQTEDYAPALIVIRLIYELIFRAFLVYQMERVLQAARIGIGRRIGFYVLLFFVVSISQWQNVIKTDAVSFLFLLLLTLSALLENAPPLGQTITGMTLLAALTLGKGNLTPLALLVVIFATVRYRQAGRRFRSSPFVCFFLAFLGFWLLAGQNPLNFPAFAQGIWQIGIGYNDAMSLPISAGQEWIEVLAGIVVIVVPPILFIILRQLPVSPAPPKSAIGGTVALSGILLLSVYKTAFTRADPHIYIFLNFSLLLLLILAAILPRPVRSREWGIAAALAGLMAAAGFALHNSIVLDQLKNPPALTSLRRVLLPWGYIGELESGKAAMRERFALPDFRQAIGEGSIDIWPNVQGLLLLNGMNYRPRPVFQGYSAYNRYTAGRNVSFLEGARAPDFLMFAFAPLDSRFAFEEDGQALVTVLRHYRPVNVNTAGDIEPQFLLMQRTAQPAPELTVPQSHSFPNVSFVDGIEIPDPVRPEDWLRLRIKVHRTMAGRLGTLVHGTGPLHLLLTDDQGQKKAGRLVIDTAEQGFLIQPYLTDNADVSALYAGILPARRIRRVQIIDPSLGQNFDGTADFTLEEIAPAVSSP